MKHMNRILSYCIAISLCMVGSAIAGKSAQSEDHKKTVNTTPVTEQKAGKQVDSKKVSTSSNENTKGNVDSRVSGQSGDKIITNGESGSSTVSKIQSQTGEQINWQVLSDGGGWSTTTGLQLFSVLGQTAAGESVAGALRLQHGFLQSFGSQSCCVGVTGNIDCDLGSVVDIADLTVLIDHLFISLDPLCCREQGNVDGDLGAVVDIADLTFLIDHLFISLIATANCP